MRLSLSFRNKFPAGTLETKPAAGTVSFLCRSAGVSGMTKCPECGLDVPADGKFCPDCGARVDDGGASPGQRDQTDDWQSREDEDWEYPAGPTTRPRPRDHKLLLGGVLVLSAVGLVEGIVQVAYADALVEIAEQEFGIGGELATGQLVVAGAFGILVSLAVAGATAYFYREGQFSKAYFWLLVAGGVAGFLLSQSIFLTALLAFGVYGLVSVMD